ncbi:STAS domain-containing protein [Peribacillus sp. B-H-3]|uniref:STAS domain-containing protein n=1 Tax=Peribacillus sp. B-H-3 TaxID=3400420 RepID=UPI003B028684
MNLHIRGDMMNVVNMDKQLQRITESILSKKAELALQRKNDNTGTYTVNEALKKWRENLIEIYANSIYKDKQDTFEQLKKWGDNVVHLLVDMQLPLDLAIEEVRYYRKTIGEIIKDESIACQFDLESFFNNISRFDSVVDQAVHWLSLSYARSHAASLIVAEKAVYELSIPLVRVTEEIGVLPLVGDLDTRRAQQLMERALALGTEYNLKVIIIDLSGVAIIDTMVADQIFKVIASLKLVGISARLTGIRPEIAQTMVNLGIDFKDIHTFSSLHLAVKDIITIQE